MPSLESALRGFLVWIAIARCLLADDQTVSLMTDAALPKVAVAILNKSSGDEVECLKVLRARKCRLNVMMSHPKALDLIASKIESSCGCFVGLADSLTIKKVGIGRIVSVLNVPKEVENFESATVVLTDLGREFLMKITGERTTRVSCSKRAEKSGTWNFATIVSRLQLDF